MSTPLVFIDTETDGLHPGRKAWEIALIRRDHLGQTETHFFVGIDIRDSNPDALSIGRFWDRHPSGRKMAGLKALPDSVNLLTQHDAAKEVMRWTFGAHLVGAIPSFDAETFARMLRSNGYLPSWHHRRRNLGCRHGGRSPHEHHASRVRHPRPRHAVRLLGRRRRHR